MSMLSGRSLHAFLTGIGLASPLQLIKQCIVLCDVQFLGFCFNIKIAVLLAATQTDMAMKILSSIHGFRNAKVYTGIIIMLIS